MDWKVALKVAVAVTGEPAGMLQGEVPVQAPLHPVNTKLGPGAAVRVMAPSAKSAVQVVPQLIPAGALVTVPEPEPVKVTVTLLG